MAEDPVNDIDSAEHETGKSARQFNISPGQTLNVSLDLKLPAMYVPVNMDHFNKMAQDAANAIEKAESFSSALKISQDCSKKLTNQISGAAGSLIKKFSLPTSSTNDLSEFLAASVSSLTYAVQPQVFAALQKTAKNQAEVVADLISSAFKTAANPIIERKRYIDRLTQAHWPLYLVGGTDLYHEVLALDDEMDDAILQNEMDCIAEKYLDDNWLGIIRDEWSSTIEIDEERRGLLLEALDNFKNKRYAETTSILMCLFVSFYENYTYKSFELTGDEKETYDWLADEHGLHEYTAIERKDQNLRQGEKLLYMFILTERGWDPWVGLLSYIVDITVSSDIEEELLDHNPNRNKICHGEQVSYGTWEHAVKSILVTDALLCLTALLQESANYRQTPS